jgi:hypothetical protein
LVGLLFALMAIIVLAWKRNGLWATLLVVILIVYPTIVISWHGDSMGLSRHSLLANVELRMAIWLIFLALADEFYVLSFHRSKNAR